MSTPWWEAPALTTLTWMLALWSILSFIALGSLLAKGHMDWKLNVRLTLHEVENGITNAAKLHFEQPHFEQRGSEMDWWEAIEMQPQRREELARRYHIRRQHQRARDISREIALERELRRALLL